MIGKLVFDRILKETRENRQGREDPYFEYVPTKKMSVFHGKPRSKRRQKALPPGLTPLEQDTLVKVKRRAYRLDMALGTCCGFQLGMRPASFATTGLGADGAFFKKKNRLGQSHWHYPGHWRCH